MNANLYRVPLPSVQHYNDNTLKLLDNLSDPDFISAINKANKAYLCWDKLRYKSWIPEKFAKNKEGFWALLRLKRYADSNITPIVDQSGAHYRLSTKYYSEFLHIIDKEMAGSLMGVPNITEGNKRHFITRNLIEESIASSQLEGANTTRAVAETMLIEGRKPQTQGEQMIVNNHRAMQLIEQEYFQEDLTFELLCELHYLITYETIPKDKQGQIRETFNEHGERLKIMPFPGRNTISYLTPDKEFVDAQLPRLIAFANDILEDQEEFIHPLVKGVMIHFWIGLLHPFVDGNGRLARILFYWYMLKHEYWAFKYLSLSEKIKQSSQQYAMAYIYSEQDLYDLTYFLHYNIEKLKLARSDFQDFITHKIEESQIYTTNKLEKFGLNERQIKLLHYFNQKAQVRTNISAYQKEFSVGKQTAMSDLKTLVENELLIKEKVRRNTFYYPTEKIERLFK